MSAAGKAVKGFGAAAEFAQKAYNELLDFVGYNPTADDIESALPELSKETRNIVKALQRDDYLGFETPDQALAEIINRPDETIANFDVSPQLKSALTKNAYTPKKPKKTLDDVSFPIGNKVDNNVNTEWLAGRGVLDLVSQGYPEPVSKRIVSGELDMREPARRARANAFGDIEYHGTHSDFTEVDPDAVDLGLHTGSFEQANNRLKDTSLGSLGGSRGSNKFRSGAQVMPLVIRRGNEITEMRDIGRWNDSVNVAPELDNIGYDTYDLYEDLDIEKRMYESPDDWVESPENRAGLDELRDILTGDGFDSIRYKNEVENSLGGSSDLTMEANKRIQDLYRDKARYMDAAALRMPEAPGLPDPSDPNAAQKIELWRKASQAKPADFLTDAERAEIERLDAERFRIGQDPSSYNDPRSTINMKPENVRSLLSAAFDPEYTGSSMLGSRIAPTAVTGYTGYTILEELMRQREAEKKKGLF